jgi:hypothetical protein
LGVFPSKTRFWGYPSIKGSASPGGSLNTFLKTKNSEGFNNIFKVEARGAKNFNVRVKMVV